MEMVVPSVSRNERVSWTIFPPPATTSVWRAISKTSARSTLRNELMFLISTFVPSFVAPTGRIETLASQRSDPFSMSHSETPAKRSRRRSACR